MSKAIKLLFTVLLILVLFLITYIAFFIKIYETESENEVVVVVCGNQYIDQGNFFGYGDLSKKGEGLFKTNCKSCHVLGKDAVGPNLSGVTERRRLTWLHDFIHNPDSVMKTGDTVVLKQYEYFGSVMTAFPTLNNTEIDSILVYIDGDDFFRIDSFKSH